MNTPPPPRLTAASGNWKPFEDELQFKIADFLYRQEEMSQGNINHLLELWALSLMKHGSIGPFDSYREIYDRIDAIEQGKLFYDKVLSLFADSILKKVMLPGSASRLLLMTISTTPSQRQFQIGENKSTIYGTVIRRWWFPICLRTLTLRKRWILHLMSR